MPQPVFGVREFSEASSPAAQYAEAIRISGFCVVPDVLSLGTLEAARSALDRIYAVQLEEIGGEERLQRINDSWTARAPLAYDRLFLDIAASPRILEIVAFLLGDPFCLMLQNGLLNVPLTGQQQNAGAWHRDLNYQHFVSSRPLSISALYCIDDFNSGNGATVILPGSQKIEQFPSEHYVDNNQITVDARAGSVLVFDSMMFHRGGLNRSEQPRRAINHVYSIPLLRPQISFPRILQGRYADDPHLRQFLGYDYETAESVTEFRNVRLGRLDSARE